MINKLIKLFLIGCIFGMASKAQSQKCNLVLVGKIVDGVTNLPIANASVYVKGTDRGGISNPEGVFKIQNICKGDYDIEISHIGCETKQVFFKIKENSVLNVQMNHNVEMLDGVHLLGHKLEKTTQVVQTISATKIQNNANENLSDLLESLTGVSTLKNGSGIGKPVIHGMYGNRVTILNNGIAQSGQQWGNDHSPEIDPLVANDIKVIKGVGALEYQGSTLGSVVMVTPKAIRKDPHLHGAANYFHETNGRGNGLNITLEQAPKKLAWKLNGTIKKYGDRKSATYFLTNTGSTEANLALQLRKQFSENWETKLYASTFNTKLGVLRGSQIGNIADLNSALARKVPFFTSDTFSYQINSPRQEVHHHLLKILNTYKISEDDFYTFTYAGQLNIRKEFDVRRVGRSNIPSLSLQQNTQFLEAKHQNKIGKYTVFKRGIQYTFTNNTNNPGTGILPLIPDYLSHQLGAFALLSKKKNRWMYEVGARYNFTYQNVAAITKTVPVKIVNYNNLFNNVNVSAGVRYRTLKQLHWAFNVGLASRNPAINELYSNGLHQGVSGLEIGNVNLKQENSVKTTFSLEGNVNQKWFFESMIYYQYIDDYIYLNPQKEIRQTIRGAFPVFAYEQTNARLFGLDLAMSYAFTDALKLGGKYSFLQGDNLSKKIPLINMPANNTSLTLDYRLPNVGKFKNTTIGIEHRYVWKQYHVHNDQDYVLPPDGYQLMSMNFSTSTKLYNTKVHFYAKASNLLNVAYRDYLNRMRYFANDAGRSVVLGVRASF